MQGEISKFGKFRQKLRLDLETAINDEAVKIAEASRIPNTKITRDFVLGGLYLIGFAGAGILTYDAEMNNSTYWSSIGYAADALFLYLSGKSFYDAGIGIKEEKQNKE